MPARVYLQARLVGELRRSPAALGRTVGVRGGDIDAGDRLRRRGDLRCAGNGERGQILGVRGFGGERVRARLDDPARFLVQLRRVEPHDPRERLAMGEAAVRRHQFVGVPRGDFDVVAEHRIVADLQ